MLLTEAEAKTKWCPFARQMVTIEQTGGAVTGPIQGYSANRFKENEGTMCFASGCGAWRWRYAPREEVPANAQVKTDPTGYSWVVDHPRIPGQIGKGYCGLAGVPEPELTYF